MKILFFCGHYVHGHDSLNVKTIENLCSCGDVYVLEPVGYLPVRSSDVEYIEEGYETKKSRFPHLALFYSTIKNYIKSAKIAKEKNIDVIVIGEYEIISIWLYRLFTKKKSYLMHHYNLDQIERRIIYKSIFNTIKNKFYHIVYEEFIRDHLVKKMGVREELAFCWNLSAESIYASSEDNLNGNSKRYDCVGLSGSNDDSFIKTIYESEKLKHRIRDEDLKVILKSQSITFDSKNLKIVKGFIRQDVYDSYVNNAFCSLVCYPDTFVYRASAVVMESMWKRQIIIGTNIQLIKFYKKKYPNIFYICDANNFVDVLLSIQDYHDEVLDDQFDAFLEEHSDSYIQKQMRESLLI